MRVPAKKTIIIGAIFILALVTIFLVTVGVKPGKENLSKKDTTNETVIPSNNMPECVVSGCNRELCVEEDGRAAVDVSPCLYKVEYACYKNASCERLENQKCGWRMTKELQNCILTKKVND